MSAGTARLPAPARPLTRGRAAGLAVRAFVVSRVLTLVAGAAGVLTMVKHDPGAAVQARRALGPLGNVLAGSVDRFDSAYYLAIAAHGYGTLASGKIAFFPLYPVLIRLLAPLTGSAVLAGVLISAGSFMTALIMLHRLTESELGRPAADATVLLLCFAPLSFFFTAVYTESLFLALSVGAMVAARTGRWRLACGLSALATLTRPTGVLMVVALVVMRVRQRRLDAGLAWVLAIPAALLLYLGGLAATGYPFLGALTVQRIWGRVSSGPVAGLAAAAWSALRGAVAVARGAGVYHPVLDCPLTPAAESVVLFIVLMVAAAALALTLRRLPIEYGALAAAQLVMCLSDPAVGQPLWSFDRFTLTMFPLWMAAGAWVARRRMLWPVLALGSAALVFYTLQFASWSFVA
jgi:hypothetical protein